MTKEPPARKGRPPKVGDRAMLVPVTLRFPPAMIERIDEIIAERLDRLDRSSVIRELIAEALDARARKKPKRP